MLYRSPQRCSTVPDGIAREQGELAAIGMRTSDGLGEPRATVRNPPWNACPMLFAWRTAERREAAWDIRLQVDEELMRGAGETCYGQECEKRAAPSQVFETGLRRSRVVNGKAGVQSWARGLPRCKLSIFNCAPCRLHDLAHPCDLWRKSPDMRNLRLAWWCLEDFWRVGLSE